VSASGYFGARQAATGACLSYNQRKQVTPPVIPTHQASSFAPAVTLPQGFENPNAGAALGSTLPGTLSLTTAAQLKACAQCACD
jgi:hypothetical protein